MFKENQMNKNAKLFITCLGVGMASYINMASAASDGVLFKIHDIVPVKNPDGKVTSCEVGATFYNRTDKEISNAQLKLIWADEVVADAINQEERNVREAKKQNLRNLPRYNTATYNSRDVTLDLRLPTMKPYQQVTLKSKIATDRCFLLLNDMDIDVTNCGTAAEGDKSGRMSSACDNLFRYIGPRNEEYYSEFKPISLDQQNAQEQSESDKKKQEINTLYKETVANITGLSQRLAASRPQLEEKTTDSKE